ncbi:MAG: hypothetical protein ACK51N_05305 [bacterium]
MNKNVLTATALILTISGAAAAQSIPASNVIRVNFEPVGTITGEVAGRIHGLQLAPQASLASSPSFNTSNLIGGSGVSQITTTNSSLFLSFCLERDDFASAGTQYFWQQNNYAAMGGANNPDPSSGSVAFNPADPTHTDPMSFRTAYLFRQFWDGSLTGYDFTGSGRGNDANSLQMAFWLMEGELQLPALSGANALSSSNQTALQTALGMTASAFADFYTTLRNMLLAEANAGAAPSLTMGSATSDMQMPADRWAETLMFLDNARSNANASAAYGVSVLNLWSSNTDLRWGTRGQDFMVVTSVPQTSVIPLPPAAWAGMSTRAVLGLTARARRRRLLSV